MNPLDKLVAYADPSATTSEALRCLRTALITLADEKHIKLLGITSSAPDEGKSYISSNLAIVTARLGKKTLLVDCDLRRPGLSRMFGVYKKTRGLSNVLLSGKTDFDDLPFVQVGIENLTLLTSGSRPPNPAELLESKKMDHVLEQVRDRFDIVYLDVPPVLSVTDPLIICRKIKGAILVAMANKTPAKNVVKSYNYLKEVGVNVLGTVLNGVKVGRDAYYSYAYGSVND